MPHTAHARACPGRGRGAAPAPAAAGEAAAGDLLPRLPGSLRSALRAASGDGVRGVTVWPVPVPPPRRRGIPQLPARARLGRRG